MTGKDWCTYFDTPAFVESNVLPQLEALPWEEVVSTGGILTRYSCWLTPNDCFCQYKYGKKTQVFDPVPIPAFLEQMSRRLEDFLGLQSGILNSINANKYSQARHDLYWHCDNERLFRASEFDRDTLIVSVSFGDTRTFSIRHKMTQDPKDEMDILLKHGDIVVMAGTMQDNYLHTIRPPNAAQLAQASSASGCLRYNLTFRFLRRHTDECKKTH